MSIRSKEQVEKVKAGIIETADDRECEIALIQGKAMKKLDDIQREIRPIAREYFKVENNRPWTLELAQTLRNQLSKLWVLERIAKDELNVAYRIRY